MGIPNRGWPPRNKGTLVADTTAQTGTWYAILVLNAGTPSTPKIVTSVVAQTGTWNEIICLSATVFATLTEIGASRAGTIGSAVFPAGTSIHGSFTNFTLTSGSVRAEGPKIPFATLTDNAITRQTAIGAVPIDSEEILYGSFTNFTLNAGASVLAFDDRAVRSGNTA